MMFPTLLVRHRDSELFQKTKKNSLVVQWLGLSAFTAKGMGSTPGRGTKILQAVRACYVTSVVSDSLWRYTLCDSFVTHMVRSIARQAPLSMGFSRKEYWSGLPCPPPGDLPNPGIEPKSPALAGVGSLPLAPPGKLCLQPKKKKKENEETERARLRKLTSRSW